MLRPVIVYDLKSILGLHRVKGGHHRDLDGNLVFIFWILGIPELRSKHVKCLVIQVDGALGLGGADKYISSCFVLLYYLGVGRQTKIGDAMHRQDPDLVGELVIECVLVLHAELLVVREE